MFKNKAVETTISTLQEALQEANDTKDICAITDRLMAAIDRLEPSSNDKLWNIEQAAAFLGVKKEKLRRWCQEERIPHIQIGKFKRFDPGRLRKWTIQQEKSVNRVWRKPA